MILSIVVVVRSVTMVLSVVVVTRSVSVLLLVMIESVGEVMSVRVCGKDRLL